MIHSRPLGIRLSVRWKTLGMLQTSRLGLSPKPLRIPRFAINLTALCGTASVTAPALFLGPERHMRLDADGIKNLLEPRDGHGLVFTLLITADHLLAHAQTPRQFGL